MSKDEASSGVIPPEDRQKREQELADVVHSTGDNLIDISAVEQPEVPRSLGGGRRTASQFKEAFLKEFENSQEPGNTINAEAELDASTSPASRIYATIPLINQIQPKPLSNETKQWLDVISKEAVAALESEPVVNLVGDLVLTFE